MKDAIICLDPDSPMNLQKQIRKELVDGILNGAFRDVSAEIGCEKPAWVTNLSGIGGINIVLMSNDTAYYRLRDDGVHDYMDAVVESNRIRSMCERSEPVDPVP